VAAEVVHHHDVACPQRRRQELVDPGEEAFAINRSIEHAGSGKAVTAQAGDEGEGLAWPVRDLREQSLTSQTGSASPAASSAASAKSNRPNRPQAPPDRPAGLSLSVQEISAMKTYTAFFRTEALAEP
jgi:hypothetical protein